MDTTFTLDSTGGKPKFQRMVELLEAAIVDGRWRPGDRLPSNRELAVRFGVTIGTVSKAMSEAVRRGIVETRVGSGTFVSAQRKMEGLGPIEAAERAVNLSLNVLPIAPVGGLLEAAMAAHAKRSGSVQMFSYAEARGIERYLRTAAAWLTTLGTPAEAGQLVLTGGVHHGLLAAFQILLQPGDPVLCDPLCYTGFRRIALLRGVQLTPVAADAEGMRPDSLEQTIRARGARVLLANPVLQNPLATVQSGERRAQIAAVCRRHDLKVIEDAISVPLADPGAPSLATLIPERTIHLTGWSKSIASGFRLGYACLPESWRSSYQEAVLGAQWFAPGYYAELIESMQAEGLLEQCIQAQRAEASARQKLLRSWLPTAVSAGIGYHAWLPCGEELPSQELCELAGSQGVSVSAGHHFASDPDAAIPDGVRISMGSCEERAKLQQGLAALSNLLAQAKSGQRLLGTAPAV